MTSETRSDRLNSAINQLKTIGIAVYLADEYRGEGENRSRVEVPAVARVWFGFSLEEWASLTRSGGNDYVGGCCAAMSHVQDTFEGWWRFGEGAIDVHELREVAESMEAHSKGWMADAVKQFETDIDDLAPWDKIAVAWHFCRDFVDLTEGFKVSGMHIPEAETALHVVASSARSLSLATIYGKHSENRGARAQDLLTIARIRPALVSLLHGLGEIAPDPVDGFAIEGVRYTEADEPEAWVIADNRFGLAVYATREEAEQILQSSIETAEQYENREPPTRFRIRALRIESDGSIHWKEEA